MKFISSFVLPIALIVSCAIAMMFGGIFVLTGIQNGMEATRERSMAGAGVAAKVDFMRRLSMDYSVWDEAARRLVLQFDEEWIDEEIGNYLFEENGYEATYIIDATGHPLYAAIAGVRAAGPAADPQTRLGSGYQAAARNLIIDAPARRPASGISLSAAGPLMFSISRVAPNSEAVRVPADRARYLVMSKLIDASMVAEITKTVQNPAMTLNGPAGAGSGDYELWTFDGRSAGSLRWTSKRPGTELRNRLLPGISLLTIIFIGLGVFVLRRAQSGARQLHTSEVTALHLANHDALTGLPNRRAFVNHLLQLSMRKEDYTNLYMDLDGFKEVNDTYGHGTGDALLRHTSERLSRVSPADAFLARLGGDEFAVVVAGSRDDEELRTLAAALLKSVRGLHQGPDEAISIGASLGIARCENTEYEDVVRRADIAMYAAKARGRDTWCFFDAALDDGRHARRALEADLRQAIEEGRITIAFQPIVRVNDGRIASMEALARWTHPTRGAIEPDIFIPVAEESGLIIPLGKHVLRAACLAAREWPYQLAVNLSPAQFWDRGLVAGVMDILRECDFPASRLEFEITETYLLRRPEAAAVVIADLRAHGIRIALDDFGTGYASIGYLKRFKLDQVKLDRSFVENIASSTEAADVAFAIIGLSKALNLTVVAEGVETEAQATVLKVAGCNYLQGWHFSRPISADQVDDALSMPERKTA